MRRNILILSLLFNMGFICSASDNDGRAALRAKAAEGVRAGNYAQAIPLYQELAALEPKNTDTQKDLMWTLWQAHRYGETAQIARRVTELLPDDLETWSLLGRAEEAAGDKPEALKAFRKCLTLAPGDASLRSTVASLEASLRNYTATINDLEKVTGRSGNEASFYARLGQAQFRQGLYGQSAKSWEKAAEHYPDNVDFQFESAKGLYYSGQSDRAVEKLQHIILGHPGFWPAIDLLTDDALARGETQMAEQILENNFTEFKVQDEPRMIKLATIYESAEEFDKCLKTLSRFLEINPNHGDALLLKAGTLMKLGRAGEAIPVYQRIFELNPWSLHALKGIAEAQSTLHHPNEALKSIDQALQLDPSDPYLLVLKARYLYESERRRESNALLIQWIRDNPAPALPILLYHGLTPFPRDAMLAYSVHMTTATFEDQIEALSDAHYAPIFADQVDSWIGGWRDLPAKSVMISFDDGRLDSFRYADPVLKRYGMKATMFAILYNVDHNLPGYANWDMLQDYQSNGRWQIQAHGDMAHGKVALDEEGREGMFLVNRQWLEKEKRLEAKTEWIERVLSDHQSVKRKMVQRLGKPPSVYAFPEGEFGQDSVPNSPEAAALNLTLIRKMFGAAFHQDVYGLNVRSRDPALLTRVEPGQNWTGEQLLRHITDDNPKTLMLRTLLRQAAWDVKPHEAYEWLRKLDESGASRGVLLADESRIRFAAEDYAGAARFAGRSLTITADPDIEALRKTARAREHFSWTPSFNLWQDNQNRQNWIEQSLFEFNLAGNTRMQLLQNYASIEAGGSSTVYDKSAGAGFSQPLGLFHKLTAQGEAHFLTGQTQTYTASGQIRSNWTDYLKTEVEAGRGLTDTAQALNDNIFTRYGRFYGSWLTRDESWLTSLKGRTVYLTDQNNEWEGELQTGYQFLPEWNLRGVYRFTIDDMKFLSPDYYSPNGLIVNQAGFEYKSSYNRPVQLQFTYLPGVGRERSTATSFVQDLDAGLILKFSETTQITPSFSLSTAPTYNRQNYNLTLTHQF